MYEVYEKHDEILPTLAGDQLDAVRVEITDDSVRLFVGPRDWSWNRETGVLTGAGVALNPPIAFDPDGLPNTLKDDTQ